MSFLSRFFRSSEQNLPEHLLTITRTQVINGFSIPGIIHNGDYFFTGLEVYSDGLIYCWDMVDLELFQIKLNTGWVTPTVPDGGECSAYGLGMWKIANGEWLYGDESYFMYVKALVKKLNPEMVNLYDCQGTTTKVIGGVNVSVFSNHNPQPFYISKKHRVFPERTRGKTFRFFFRDTDNCIYLVSLSLFRDGHVEIADLANRRGFEMEQLQELIKEGKLLTEVPAGERVHVMGLGSFEVKEGHFIDVEENYKELLDEHSSMNGNLTSLERCRDILDKYKARPTVALRAELAKAYEAIPAHNRMYVGDMDIRDTEVRMIIYGGQEIENWSHYWAAKEFGEELPVISIPKPEDEEGNEPA